MESKMAAVAAVEEHLLERVELELGRLAVEEQGRMAFENLEEV